MPNARSHPASAIARPARRNITPIISRLMWLDFDVDGQRLAAATDEDRTARRRGIEVVAADRDAHVVGLREDAVRRIEALPADLRNVELDPRVRGLTLRLVERFGPGIDVAAHVARRHAEQTREADHQIR